MTPEKIKQELCVRHVDKVIRRGEKPQNVPQSRGQNFGPFVFLYSLKPTQKQQTLLCSTQENPVHHCVYSRANLKGLLSENLQMWAFIKRLCVSLKETGLPCSRERRRACCAFVWVKQLEKKTP